MHQPMLTIVPATLSHLREITAIYNEAVLNSTATFDTQPKSLSDREQWLLGRNPAHPVIVALDEQDTVVGWGSLSPYSERPAYRHTVEDSIYVRSDARGQGVGAMILAGLIQLAHAEGHHSLIARIAEGNEASVRLHEKYDFTVVGTLREVGRKFDRWLDVVFMQKVLRPE